MTGWTGYAQLSQDKTRIVLVLLVNELGQHDLAEFAEQWAQNIEEQGWLERGVKHAYA